MSDPAKTTPEPESGEPYVSKVDRRTALAWVGVVGAATVAAGAGVVVYRQNKAGEPTAQAKGYGTDPKLNPPIKAPWPRIMGDAQLQVAAVVADLILPSSGTAPAATAVGVPDFLNEWVSAPYPDQLKDREILLKGLDDLGRRFLKADAAERGQRFKALAGTDFFKRMRALTVGAYYTTDAGFKDIGYIGNVARQFDPGPSDTVKAELERRLQTLGL